MQIRSMLIKGLTTFCLVFFSLSSCGIIFGTFDSNKDVNETEDETTSDTLIETSVFSGLNYAAFGDSINDSAHLANSSEACPNVVGSILGCNVRNKAVSGSTLARHSDEKYSSKRCIAEDVLRLCESSGRYHIISVAGGVNDHGIGCPLGTIDDDTTETVYGSLNIIAKALTERFPDAFIFFVTPMKFKNYEFENYQGYYLSDVADAVKAVAEKYNLPVLDLFNTSQFETASSGMNHPECDGQHPIKEFIADYMAPQTAKFIQDNYKKND